MDVRVRAMNLALMAAKADAMDVMDAVDVQEAALMNAQATALKAAVTHAPAHARVALVVQEAVDHHALRVVQEPA